MRKEKYVLRDGEVVDTKSMERAKFYLVKKVKDGREFFDVVMEVDNFVFELSPAKFYSPKSKNLYRSICWHLSQGH
jgi:hypothetical protein